MTTLNKIFSDCTNNFPYFHAFVKHFNQEMCCTNLKFSYNKPSIITIYHYISTELESVGLQMWDASILMADWIIGNQAVFQNLTIMELGCGVGLLSILISNYCKIVYATDFNLQVLDLCSYNIAANNIKNIKIKSLDWYYSLANNFKMYKMDNQSKHSFYLSEHDKESLSSDIDLIIASDVVYDDDLTNAFMRIIYDLLLSNIKAKVIIFVQKRIICSITNETFAPYFSHFVNCLDELHDYEDESNNNVRFVVENIDIDNIPQYFQYENRPSYVYGYQIYLATK